MYARRALNATFCGSRPPKRQIEFWPMTIKFPEKHASVAISAEKRPCVYEYRVNSRVVGYTEVNLEAAVQKRGSRRSRAMSPNRTSGLESLPVSASSALKRLLGSVLRASAETQLLTQSCMSGTRKLSSPPGVGSSSPKQQ
jgi:hypothetical protein